MVKRPSKFLVKWYGARGHLRKRAPRAELLRVLGVKQWRTMWSNHWVEATKGFASCGAARKALTKLNARVAKANKTGRGMLPKATLLVERKKPFTGRGFEVYKTSLTHYRTIKKCPRKGTY